MRNRCGNESTMATSARSATSLVLKLARLGLAAVAACVLLAVGATAAVAAPSHKFTERFGVFSNTVSAGVAVQQSSGDVYVLDRGATKRVLHLGADGSFLGQFWAGLSPDAASADYTAIASDDFNDQVALSDPANGGDRPNGAIDRFSAAGVYSSQIDEANVPAGTFFPSDNGPSWPNVAVNPTNGNIYVIHYGAANDLNPADPIAPPGVYVFDSTGAFVMNITGAGTDGQINTAPTAVAVDAAGNVYVAEIDNGTVKRFNALGVYDITIPVSAGAIAVNQTSGDLYALNGWFDAPGNTVTHFDSAGNQVGTFGSDVLSNATGLAVESSTDRVYVTDALGVEAFDAFEAPDVTTDAATAPATDGATLHGTVNPQGVQAFAHYDYGRTEVGFEASTADVDLGSGTSPVPAPDEVLTGLAPNKQYQFELVVTTADGTFRGGVQTFTTLTVPPTIAGEASSDIRSTISESSAKLSGTVNPNNTQTSYTFEYGTDTGYGSSVPAGDAGAGDTPTPVNAAIDGLDPSTTYHWRITADNGTDPVVNGADQTFTTPSLVPEVSGTAVRASSITKTSAIVTATVDTKGRAGTYHFTATSGSFVGTSALIDIPAASGPRTVAATIDGLPTQATINVRASILTDGGSAQTDAISFDTLPFDRYDPPPVIPDPGYGCNAPHLNNYSAKTKPGKTITLTGSDLGIGGVVTFGSTEADSGTWTSGSIQVDVPSNAKGTAKVTANCGKASNTIDVKVVKKVTCKKGYKKKQVKGKTKCVKKKKAKKKK
jgi:hypothetical protein